MSEHKLETLVFIPFPLMGHLVSSVELAKHLIERDQHLSITILIIKPSTDNQIDIDSIASGLLDSRINFLQLSKNGPVNVSALMRSPTTFIVQFIESLMDDVRKEVAKIKEKSGLSGFVIDMFCTPMIDVANEFKIPTYVYFTSGAAVLGLLFHLQSIRDDQCHDVAEYLDNLKLSVPTYVHRFPGRLIPSPVYDGDISFLDLFKRFRETKGILINTFQELEQDSIQALNGDDKIPPVYPVGPILHDVNGKNDQNTQKQQEIIGWLDKQPESSVVFLCFGSNGCFDEDQVKEIAFALEHSGHQFLWSLRKPPGKEKMEFPRDYDNPDEVLPKGFLERIEGIGKVIGWAPQMAVLCHPAVGGFVSHCGWNSTLESIWCGVPTAVWPLGAEQQANSFQMVKELGMAVEIQMDYRKNSDVIVVAQRIEKAIKKLMDPENEIREKVKVMKKKSETALIEGGSSYHCLGRLLDDIKQL